MTEATFKREMLEYIIKDDIQVLAEPGDPSQGIQPVYSPQRTLPTDLKLMVWPVAFQTVHGAIKAESWTPIRTEPRYKATSKCFSPYHQHCQDWLQRLPSARRVHRPIVCTHQRFSPKGLTQGPLEVLYPGAGRLSDKFSPWSGFPYPISCCLGEQL